MAESMSSAAASGTCSTATAKKSARDMGEETFKWSEEETHIFLSLREKHNGMFKTGKRGAMKDAFTFILKEMELDNRVTAEQARKKYNNLAQKYKELKHPPTGKGMEDDTCSPISWPFYEDMDHILGHRPIMAPPCLVSSLQEYEDDHVDLYGKTSTDKHEEPPSKKNRTERMYEMMIEQNKQLQEQEKTLIKQNDAFLGLFGRLVNTIENKNK